MSGSERRKGVKGEREVRAIFEAHGWTVRGLEAGGDLLAIKERRPTLAIEVKRQETLRLPLWIRQLLRDAPVETVPVLVYRRNGEQWRALVPAQALPEALLDVTDPLLVSDQWWRRLAVETVAALATSMMSTLAPPRYVVRETWGFRTAKPGGNSRKGVSVAVLDRLWQWKAVAIFRSEDYGGTHADRVRHARAHADDHAAALNERAA